MFCFWSGPLCGIKNLIFFHLNCYRYSLWINDYQESLTRGYSSESTIIEIYPTIYFYFHHFFFSGLLIKFNILSFVWIKIYSSSIVFQFSKRKKKGFHISLLFQKKKNKKNIFILIKNQKQLGLSCSPLKDIDRLQESTWREEKQYKSSYFYSTRTLRTRFFPTAGVLMILQEIRYTNVVTELETKPRYQSD